MSEVMTLAEARQEMGPASTDVRGLGIRLEAAAATLTGAAERNDAAAIGLAIENRGLARDGFRAGLEAVAGVPVSLIERWLSL